MLACVPGSTRIAVNHEPAEKANGLEPTCPLRKFNLIFYAAMRKQIRELEGTGCEICVAREAAPED